MRGVAILIAFMLSHAAVAGVQESLTKAGFVEVPAPPQRCDHQGYYVSLQDQNAGLYEEQDVLVTPKPRPEEGGVYGFTTGTVGRVTYVGEDRGEWGGGLYASRGASNRKKILSGNVQSIQEYGAGLIVVISNDHLGLNYGAVHFVKDAKDRPKSTEIIRLPMAPRLARFFSMERVLYLVSWTAIMEVQVWPDGSMGRYRIISANEFKLGDTISFVRSGPYVVLGGRCAVTVVYDEGNGFFIPAMPVPRVRHYVSSANNSLELQ